MLYADEMGEVQSEVVSAFESFNEELDVLGENNANSWIKSFLTEIKEQLPDVVAHIEAAFSSLVVTPTMSLSGMAGGTSTNSTFSPSYNFYGTSADSACRESQCIGFVLFAHFGYRLSVFSQYLTSSSFSRLNFVIAE